MFNITIVLGVVLVLAILFVIFRISTLVSIVKGDSKKRITSSNTVNAVLLMVFLIGAGFLFFWFSISKFDEYTLPVASKHGEAYETMFWVTMAVTGIVFLITHILLFYFSYKYRHKEGKKALYYPHNNKLEVIWTAIPAVVLALLVLSGWKIWSNIFAPAPKNAQQIEVLGYQFAWKCRYAGKDGKLGSYDYRLIDATNTFGLDFSDKASFDDFSPRKMVLPAGEPVTFKIRSRDVLHSVFAPYFRLKMDAVPGMPTQFTFTPTKTTEQMRQETGNPDFQYEIACAELCGRGHFAMRMLVDVVTPEEYEKWYNDQKPWLSSHKDYLSKVPDDLKEVAMIKTGLEDK